MKPSCRSRETGNAYPLLNWQLETETVPRIAIPEPHTRRDYTAKALPQYERAIRLAGGEPLIIPLDRPNEEIARLVTLASAILLPGSPADVDPEKYGAAPHPRTAAADPRRDNADELLLQDAHNMRKPILAICYGLQSLNVWRTGTLRQHIEGAVEHNAKPKGGHAHTVRLEPESRLARIMAAATPEPSPTHWVNSSHHQAVEVPGDGLRIVARCPDDQIIEAVEDPSAGYFVLGVQWHPERMVEEDPASLALFRALIDAARARQHRPRTPSEDFESLPR